MKRKITIIFELESILNTKTIKQQFTNFVVLNWFILIINIGPFRTDTIIFIYVKYIATRYRSVTLALILS